MSIVRQVGIKTATRGTEWANGEEFGPGARLRERSVRRRVARSPAGLSLMIATSRLTATPGSRLRIAAALTVLLTGVPRAHAEAGLILVESLSAPAGDLRAMDYVAPGTTIDLGTSTVVVLDHLATCTRETVTGGVLNVQSPNSQVDGGSIARSQLDCDGRQLQLDATRAQGGGQVYRAIDQRPLVLYGTAPLILATRGGTIRIERDDQPAPPIEIQVPESSKGRSVTVDLALSHQELAPGGSYRVIAGGRQQAFVVDRAAKRGADVPLLARLLPI